MKEKINKNFGMIKNKDEKASEDHKPKKVESTEAVREKQ